MRSPIPPEWGRDGASRLLSHDEVCGYSIRIRETLIGGSLLLYDRCELIEILQHQRNVFLELNGLCFLERGLELRQALLLLHLRHRLVRLKRGDILFDLFRWLGELFALRVDAGDDR